VYEAKWAIFCDWCSGRDIDPVVLEAWHKTEAEVLETMLVLAWLVQ
jgi:hypothetical protein